MDNKDGIREFLASRRAKITPEQAGLPLYGTNRRVKGLRREEVAMLAGISVEYYSPLNPAPITRRAQPARFMDQRQSTPTREQTADGTRRTKPTLKGSAEWFTGGDHNGCNSTTSESDR